MSLTAGQVEAAIGALAGLDTNSLAEAWTSNCGDLDADATVAEDALVVIAPFFPEAATIATLIAILGALAPLVSSSQIAGGSGANLDPLGPGHGRG